MPRFSCVAESSLLLIRDDQVFLLLRANTGYRDGQYCLPAGHKEEGETARQAAAREAWEEVGIAVEIADLECVHVLDRLDEDERLSFFFRARQWTGEPANAEPHKCDDARWFPLDALPPNMIDWQRAAVEGVGKGEGYGEFGWKD